MEILLTSCIVITGQQDWDIEVGSNCRNLAIEFSRYNRVLFINPPLDRNTVFRRRTNPKVRKFLDIIKSKDTLKRINQNLWVLYPDQILESINWIRNQSVFEFLNKRNNLSYGSCIRRALDKLKFQDFILFVDNDIFRSFHLKEILKPKVFVYYSRDYLLGVKYWKRHGEVMEPQLIKNSDVCVANSEYLSEYCKEYNHRSYYVGQGCDSAFSVKEMNLHYPSDIKNIPSPIIGYVGVLTEIRLNIEWIEYIALARKEWQIILVGPEDNSFLKSKLHHLPNVHFTGIKGIKELPAYINAFDVCINPQLVNETTIGNYPRKIDEYLNMGKPVVVTKTKGMDVFKKHTYVANTKEEYVYMLNKALIEDNEVFRIERPSHTWENSVKEIYRAINSFIRESESKLVACDTLK